jgi:UDPglucose 6-dehydrogenase
MTDKSIKAGVVGVGVVGGSLVKSFRMKQINPVIFDKYKYLDGSSSDLRECLPCDILFICLPTLLKEGDGKEGYDKSAILETLTYLTENQYQGIAVIKSTVEPGTTQEFSEKFKSLKLVHNPEFLSADTAFEDFHNQTHIVLGGPEELTAHVAQFYKQYYPEATISLCSSVESESMKIFANSFYAVKIQFFNELYLSCVNNGADFAVVKNLMLKNGWINPQHTQVPGKDNQLSYGGMCFPKDTVALENYLLSRGLPCAVLSATIRERNSMR